MAASVSEYMPNSSFKTYIWEKTSYAVLFASPYQQRHSPSQTALEVLRQELRQQKLGYMVFRHFEVNPAVHVSIQEGITMPIASSGGWL